MNKLDKQLWSKFTSEYLEKGKWVTYTRLFMGNLSNVDITQDSRFFDVKNARQNTKFIKLTYEQTR